MLLCKKRKLYEVLMKSVLRFEKIKDFNSLRQAQFHHERSVNVLNANYNVSNVSLIKGGSLEQKVKDIFNRRNIKIRKNSVIAMDCIMSLSPDFFDSKKSLEEFSVRVIDFLNKEFGENCISAVLHLDESTPHVHAVILPVNKFDEVYRLTARTMFDKSNLARLQKSYNEYFKEFGVTYSRGSKAKHNDIKKYYTELNDFNAKKRNIYNCYNKIKADKRIYFDLYRKAVHDFIKLKTMFNKLFMRYKNIQDELTTSKKELDSLKINISKTLEVFSMKLKKYRSVDEMLQFEKVGDLIDYEKSLDILRYELENNLIIDESSKDFDHLGKKNKPFRKKGL